MISIIVPFYNTEKYLKQCLLSLQKQTFSTFEVLMINDGSRDHSLDIAKEFTSDSRFRLFDSTHVGFSQAKNIGLDNAKGEYIGFVDSDDYVEPTYLEELYNQLIETNTDISCCNYYQFKEIATPEHIERESEVYNGTDKMKMLYVRRVTNFLWNKLFKRELFDEIRFKDAIALSDIMEIYKLFDKAKSISCMKCCLINHRIHNENTTYRVRNFVPEYWEHRINVFIDMTEYIGAKYPEARGAALCRLLFELKFAKEHFGNEVYKAFLESPRVKEMLKWRNNRII